MMSTFTPSNPCEPAQSISLSKCSVFHVEEAKMPSPRCAADDTTFGDRACTTGVFKFVQELHLRTLHRNLKQLRNLHSCLDCHDQAPVVEQQWMSSTCLRTASVWSSK